MMLIFLQTLPFLLVAQTKAFIRFDLQPGRPDRSVMISWAIAPRGDTIPFEVERSRDKRTWEKISAVAGNLQEDNSYLDMYPSEGINYYRVKTMGGKTGLLFSPVKWVQIGEAGKVIIWPNPADKILYVKTPFTNGTLDIINSAGKHVQKITITNYITNVSTQHLSKGLYFLQVKHQSGTLVERFIKD